MQLLSTTSESWGAEEEARWGEPVVHEPAELAGKRFYASFERGGEKCTLGAPLERVGGVGGAPGGQTPGAALELQPAMPPALSCAGAHGSAPPPPRAAPWGEHAPCIKLQPTPLPSAWMITAVMRGG